MVTEPAVAVNVVDVAPAGTTVEVGTDSAVVLLDASPTVLPPVGAVWSRVTVQVVAAPETMLDGAHASDETLGLGVTFTVAVALPPSVAVRVTVCGVVTTAAVAVNVADVALPATLTEAGTGSAVELLDAKVTVLPPAGAPWFKVTVHVVVAPDATLAGAHASVDTARLGATVTVAVVLPPRLAVIVTVWGIATDPAVGVNVVVVVPAGTVMDAGTGSAVELLDASVTRPPPERAG